MPDLCSLAVRVWFLMPDSNCCVGLHAQVQARLPLHFGIAHLVVCLRRQRRGQQTGRHRRAPVVETVEGSDILIPEQLVPGLAQRPMETVPAHQLLEVVFDIKQASL